MSSPARQLIFFLFAVLISGGVGAAAPSIGAIQELVSQAQYPEAMNALDAYLGEHPGDAQARFLRGVVLAEQGEAEAAIKEFTVLTRDFPDLPEPHNNLAVLYAAQGDFVKARDALLFAISTHPSYATAHENLGDIYTKMAGVAYDKALQLDSDNPSARAKLALVHELFSLERGGSRAVVPDSQIAKRSAPVVAASPAAPVASSKPVDEQGVRNVLFVLSQWADAWGNRDVGRYLSFYAADFSPPKGMTRDRWNALRKKRISKPRFIRVGIEEPQVEFIQSDLARVVFQQSYRSDTYQDRVRKVLTLSRIGKSWKITNETTVP